MAKHPRSSTHYYDGIGYVNNKGTFSRYWGLSFYYEDKMAKRADRKKIRVGFTLCVDGVNTKFDLRAHGFDMNVQQAAVVAGYFYEGGVYQLKPFIVKNRSNSVRLLVNLVDRTIKIPKSSLPSSRINMVRFDHAPFKAKVGEDPADRLVASGDREITLDRFKVATPAKPVSTQVVTNLGLHQFTPPSHVSLAISGIKSILNMLSAEEQAYVKDRI